MRTVIPEVPVEPVVLGAGLGLEAAGSYWDSVVVWFMARNPSELKKGGRGE